MKTQRILSLLLTAILLCSLFATPGAIPAAGEGGGENLAYRKPAYTNGEKKTAAKITDGDPDSYWTAVGVPLYAEVDLESVCRIDRVIVRLPVKEMSVTSYKYAYNVYGSLDGVNFDRIGQMEEPLKPTKDGFVFDVEGAPEYRVIRVMSTMSTKGSYSSTVISEIEVYGKATEREPIPTRTSIEFPSYEEWLLENCGVDVSKIADENGKYRIKDTYTKDDTYAALAGLVERILGKEYLTWFTFEITEPGKNGLDFYEISDKDGKILIRGNEGVSIAAGLNHYLKYYCKVNVSQETKQVRMPGAVVPVGKTVRNESPYEVRYTYNYCTLSYTMSYYGYEQWQRELDYLMLSGINVILDTTATEALWVLYLQNYGYTLQEAIEFVCGYTWKAWWLMGNLQGYGGPVSDNWIVDTVEMARVNQRYMSVMGADPCLQAFVGTLPIDFNVKAAKTLSDQGFDNVAKYMTPTGGWAGFTRPYALNTTYDGFASMAAKFYETQNYIYGRIGDYYAGDFLHEVDGNFKLDKQFDKANMSRTVLDRLLDENDHAVWIIQSWWANPLPEVVAGWGDDREDHILLLDLAAVQSPRWSNQASYGGPEFGGSSWCYCILENYGGRDGVHLNLKTMTRNMASARKEAKHMKGIGLTSEGTERNPALFDLFWEQGWSKTAISVPDWLTQYAERRYGGTGSSAEAWSLLLKTVYGGNTTDGTTVNYAINNYPKFDYTGSYFTAQYSSEQFENALRLLLADFDRFKNEETYVYDLVELFSNKLSDVTTYYLGKMYAAAKTADYETFHANKTAFLHAMMLLDELTSFEKDQLLGNWFGRAEEWANDQRNAVYSDFDLDLMRLDAIILITNWSTIDLGNYAYRQYNGLMKDYYYRMWNNFLTRAEDRIRAGTAITGGNDTLGVSNTVTYYNYARQIAVDVICGKTTYLSEPVPVDGDASHRGLKALLDEICDTYFGKPVMAPNRAELKEGSPLTVSGGVISGALKGNTAADLSAQFTAGFGAAVVFVDGEGSVAADDAVVPEGMKAMIREEDGSLYDGVGLTVGQITVARNAGELEALQKTISDFEKELEGIPLDGFDCRVRGSIDAVLSAKDATSFAALEKAAQLAPAALADAKAEKARVEKLQKSKRAALSGSLEEMKNDFAELKADKTPAEVKALYEEAIAAGNALGVYAPDRAIKEAMQTVAAARKAVDDEKARQDAEEVPPSDPHRNPGENGKRGLPAPVLIVIIAATVLLLGGVVLTFTKKRKKKA